MHAYIELICPLKKKKSVSLINTTIYLNLIRKFNVGAQGQLYIESGWSQDHPGLKKTIIMYKF